MVVYFRSVWGGWVTDVRMGSLLRAQGQASRSCVLGCSWDEDSLYHYGRCNVFWDFLPQPLGTGLGISLACRSAEAFLLLTDMSAEDKVRVAIGMYAPYRTVQFLRHHLDSLAQPECLLKLYMLRAHGGSKAGTLLRAAGNGGKLVRERSLLDPS